MHQRYALIGTTVLCAFALATYACGGDDDSATSTPDAGTSTSSSSGSSSSSSGFGTSTSSSTGGTSTSSSSSSSGSSTSSTGGVPPADAGEVGDASDIPDSGGAVPDGDTAFDGSAGTLCQVGSVQEAEVNDTTPNTIPGKTGTFCGSLASPTDVDKVQFTLPADAITLDISTQNTNAGFVLQGTVDGVSFTLDGPDAGSSFPFHAGSTYVLTATSTAGSGASDYIIGVTIGEQPPRTLCAAGSVSEVEPNDSDATATPVTNGTGSWCGNISTATDIDEFKFTMPTGKTTIATTFQTSSGDVTITATHNGTAFDPNSNNIPINAGEVYIYKFTSATANNAYIFNLTLN